MRKERTEFMPLVNDIYKALDTLAPFITQEAWDNSGILVGSKSNTVSKIMLTLDITYQTALEAKEIGADLVISHHPVIFSPLKQLNEANPAVILSKHNINAICMHTNFDIASGGMNDILCERLGLTPIKGEVLSDSENENIVRICNLAKPTDVGAIAKSVKEAPGCRVVRYNDTGKAVTKIGVCSGSGAEFFPYVLAKGCELLITGDIKHHDFIDANNAGISLIDAGHFYTENIFYDNLKSFLQRHFPEIEIAISEKNIDIVNVI